LGVGGLCDELEQGSAVGVGELCDIHMVGMQQLEKLVGHGSPRKV
jgi:hypothetical protein